MYRSLSLLAGGLVWLSAVSLQAEEAVLGQMYGSGVHAYFSRDYVEAHGYLTTAIEGGSEDPRCYYFRGLAYVKLGRETEAEMDFQKGAELESRDIDGFYNVARSLERIQGKTRLLLEQDRVKARMAALKRAEQLRKARYEAFRGEEERVLKGQISPPPGPTANVPKQPPVQPPPVQPDPDDPFAEGPPKQPPVGPLPKPAVDDTSPIVPPEGPAPGPLPKPAVDDTSPIIPPEGPAPGPLPKPAVDDTSPIIPPEGPAPGPLPGPAGDTESGAGLGRLLGRTLGRLFGGSGGQPEGDDPFIEEPPGQPRPKPAPEPLPGLPPGPPPEPPAGPPTEPPAGPPAGSPAEPLPEPPAGPPTQPPAEPLPEPPAKPPDDPFADEPTAGNGARVDANQEEVTITAVNKGRLEVTLNLSGTPEIEHKLKPGEEVTIKLPKGNHPLLLGSYEGGRMVSGTSSKAGVVVIKDSETWVFTLQPSRIVQGVEEWTMEVKP